MSSKRSNAKRLRGEMKKLVRTAACLGLPLAREWLQQVRLTDRAAYDALLQHSRVFVRVKPQTEARALLRLDTRTERLQRVAGLVLLQPGGAARMTPYGKRESAALLPDTVRSGARLWLLSRQLGSQEPTAATPAQALLLQYGESLQYATEAPGLIALRAVGQDAAMDVVRANHALLLLHEAARRAMDALGGGRKRPRPSNVLVLPLAQRSDVVGDDSYDTEQDEGDETSEAEDESAETSASISLGSQDSESSVYSDASFSCSSEDSDPVTDSSEEDCTSSSSSGDCDSDSEAQISTQY